MSLKLGVAIYNLLKNDSNIAGKIQDKIYPVFAPDETLVPFVVYEYKSNNTTYSKDGFAYDDCTLLVHSISDNYTESLDIAQLIRNQLERKEGTYNNVYIQHCLVSSIITDFGIDGFLTTIEFAVRAK